MGIKRVSTVLVIIMVLGICSQMNAHPYVHPSTLVGPAAANGLDDPNEYVKGEIIIGFYGPMAFKNKQSFNDIATKYGLNLKDKNEELNAALYSNVDEKTLSKLQADPNIKYIERNYYEHLAETIPNDPDWSFQWGLPAISAPDAWDTITNDTTGTLRVAILDTGINYTNPDINGNYLPIGYDWANNENDPMDDVGHGSHVAGILSALGNNSVDTAGTIWRTQLFVEKTLPGGAWEFGKGVVHAVLNGAKIISYSGGGRDLEHKEQAVQFASNHGILFIASSGNDAGPILYPAAYPEVLAVGAIDRNSILAAFSNFGPEQDLVAPGVDIISHGLTGRYSMGQIIYLDSDRNGLVSSNDQRLDEIPGTVYMATSIVNNGDPDERSRWGIVGFNANETHVDNNGNTQYNDGEFIYIDVDADNQVSANDIRLTGFWVGPTLYDYQSVVNAGDPDINDVLIAFNANENHTLISFLSGTSMACPHVSGVAALTWSLNPDLSRDDLRFILENTADDLGPVGFDNAFGNGRVNASRCVTNASFRYSIDVTPATQTITPGSSITYNVAISLVQGPSQTVSIDLDSSYPLNPDLTASFSNPSGTPPFSSTLTITASQTASFTPEVLRIRCTVNKLGHDFRRYSDYLSISTIAAPGDCVWIKTADSDDGSTPRSGDLWLSPDIWSTPDPPELGKTNTLNVRVRNGETVSSGQVLVQAWFCEYSPYVNIIELPSLGPETINDIPSGSDVTVSFSWFLPSTFESHICVFAQAWRPGLEPFTNQFDIVNNNNIGERNFQAVTPSSPYSTVLRIRNPTDDMLFVTLHATAPDKEWVVDFCRASNLNGTRMDTPLIIPADGYIDLRLTIIPPEDYKTGRVSIWATFDDYDKFYSSMSGFTYEVIKNKPEPQKPGIDEFIPYIFLLIVILSFIFIGLYVRRLKR